MDWEGSGHLNPGDQAPTTELPPQIRKLVVAPFVTDRESKPQAWPRSAEKRSGLPVRDRILLENVWLGYDENWVVQDVTLPVREGEILALIGASGSGKSTLLRSLNRMNEQVPGAVRAGQITLDGDEVMDQEVNGLRRQVGMVFQQPNPFGMSIYDNVAYPLVEHNRGRFGLLVPKVKSREFKPIVMEVLDKTGLFEEVKDRLGEPASKLSGGQQQRLCIARALAAKPEVLLLDEPCSALDPESTAKIEKLLLDLQEELAIVIVTHNLGQAARISDQVAFLHAGRLHEYGTRDQVFEHPEQPQTREYIAGTFG